MIKKSYLFVIIAMALFALTSGSPYKDGCYSGSSRSFYTAEPYYGFANISIENGKFTKVEFFIRDSDKHELFDGQYEKYFVGNDVYIQQSRNDWKGVQTYPQKLLKCQDLDKVDAITGATWSYNIFRSSVKAALATQKDKK